MYITIGMCAVVLVLMLLAFMLLPEKAEPDPGLQTFRAVSCVVCAMVLLVSAGLTAAGFVELRRVDSGIKPQDSWMRHPAVLAMNRHPEPLNLYGPNVIRSEI